MWNREAARAREVVGLNLSMRTPMKSPVAPDIG
jgi:hypothetical protein